MHITESKIGVVAIVAAMALTLHVNLEGVDVQVEHDKTFDFRPMRTWGWNAERAGEVKMARTKDDDPDAMKKRVEPLIMDAVAAEMTSRGLKQATSAPDLTVAYFMLLTLGSETQTAGQFLPATAMWGLPPFAPATQSLKFMNRGSLVLDLSAKGVVVWRGLAQAGIALDATPKKRESVLREAVRDLLKRYPPKR
jgi:hypothetical protein